jgi:hypothetical protein
MVMIETTVDGVFSSEDALRPYGVTDVRMPCMADIAAKLTGQFAGCLADKIRGPAATTSGPTGSELTEAPAAAPASAQERTFAPSAAAQASESLDLMSTVAMPVLKRLAPVVAGLMLGLILGMLLGQRRRIVIMTAPVPPGTVPPTRAML